jgi:hypothetical protein
MHGIENRYIVGAKFVDNVWIPIGPELLEVPRNNLPVQLWYREIIHLALLLLKEIVHVTPDTFEVCQAGGEVGMKKFKPGRSLRTQKADARVNLMLGLSRYECRS